METLKADSFALLRERVEAKRHKYEDQFFKGCWKYDKVHEDELLVLYSQSDRDTGVIRYYEGFLKDSSGLRPSSSGWGIRAWTFWTCSQEEALSLLKSKLESRRKVGVMP